MQYILLALIFAYAAFVIVKKVKAMKEGKYCSCNCSNCPSSSKCKSIE